MSGLLQMAKAELARRRESGGEWPALSFVVTDNNPDAMTDVQAAVKAIIADAENRATGTRKRVFITSGIHEAVVTALRAAHPRRFIVFRTVEESGARHVPMPELAAGSGPSSAAEHIDEPDRADAAERAAARLARLQGLI